MRREVSTQDMFGTDSVHSITAQCMKVLIGCDALPVFMFRRKCLLPEHSLVDAICCADVIC